MKQRDRNCNIQYQVLRRIRKVIELVFQSIEETHKNCYTSVAYSKYWSITDYFLITKIIFQTTGELSVDKTCPNSQPDVHHWWFYLSFDEYDSILMFVIDICYIVDAIISVYLFWSQSRHTQICTKRKQARIKKLTKITSKWNKKWWQKTKERRKICSAYLNLQCIQIYKLSFFQSFHSRMNIILIYVKDNIILILFLFLSVLLWINYQYK